MEHPYYRPSVFEVYDTENDQFRKELGKLIKLAYAASLYRDAAEGVVSHETQVSEVYEIEEKVVNYNFYGRHDTGEVEVVSTIYTDIETDDEGLSDEAARLIAEDIQRSDALEEMNESLGENLEVGLQNAKVEHFVRRTFLVKLPENDIRIRTDFGYSVNMLEIVTGATEELTSLDRSNERVMDVSDLFEMANGLYMMGLVSAEQVERFLDGNS